MVGNGQMDSLTRNFHTIHGEWYETFAKFLTVSGRFMIGPELFMELSAIFIKTFMQTVMNYERLVRSHVKNERITATNIRFF